MKFFFLLVLVVPLHALGQSSADPRVRELEAEVARLRALVQRYQIEYGPLPEQAVEPMRIAYVLDLSMTSGHAAIAYLREQLPAIESEKSIVVVGVGEKVTAASTEWVKMDEAGKALVTGFLEEARPLGTMEARLPVAIRTAMKNGPDRIIIVTDGEINENLKGFKESVSRSLGARRGVDVVLAKHLMPSQLRSEAIQVWKDLVEGRRGQLLNFRNEAVEIPPASTTVEIDPKTGKPKRGT
jgi:hypothetical protein